MHRDSSCASNSRDNASSEDEDQEIINTNMEKIRHKILILSGKGGVGKSTIAVNLAFSLALAGKKVGLLDIDIHGPSIPKLLNLKNTGIHVMENKLLPTEYKENLKVMSIGLLLPSRDDAVIWRGPLKYSMIKQFLKDVEWGELDYLVVDSPPGTGDEPLSIAQLINNTTGAIIVTTPQEVALIDVRKCINFCRSLNLPVLGVIENMSGFICPRCKDHINIFKTGGGEKMAHDMGVRFLGKIPIDPQIVDSCDSGTPFIDSYAESKAAKALADAIRLILQLDDEKIAQTGIASTLVL